jgi:hypothetical protein
MKKRNASVMIGTLLLIIAMCILTGLAAALCTQWPWYWCWLPLLVPFAFIAALGLVLRMVLGIAVAPWVEGLAR